MLIMKDTPFGKYPVIDLPKGTSKAKRRKLDDELFWLQLTCFGTPLSDEEFLAKWNEIEEAVLNGKASNY